MFQRRLFQLDDRLTLCANFVREGVRLADIGTDHGYLPIYLAKTGKITRGIAADINIGPLQKAAMHIKKYHAEDLVEARLSNGWRVDRPYFRSSSLGEKQRETPDFAANDRSGRTALLFTGERILRAAGSCRRGWNKGLFGHVGLV